MPPQPCLDCEAWVSITWMDKDRVTASSLALPDFQGLSPCHMAPPCGLDVQHSRPHLPVLEPLVCHAPVPLDEQSAPLLPYGTSPLPGKHAPGSRLHIPFVFRLGL